MAKSLGTLAVIIGADTSQFSRSMQEMKTSLSNANKEIGNTSKEWSKSFGNIEKQARNLSFALMGIGGAVTAGFLKAAGDTGKLGEELLNMQAKTGMSVEELSRLKTMLEMSGATFSDLGTAVKGMSNTLFEASNGSTTAATTFDRLGLSIATLQAMSPEQRFWAISNAVASIADANDRAAIAQDVFGKSGQNLLPLLDQGTAAITAQKDEVDKLGTTMTQKQAEEAAAFDDSVDKMKEAMEGLKTKIATAVMPALEDLAGKFTNVITKVTDWAEKNPDLVKTIGEVGGVILAAGGILYALSSLSKAIIAINAAMIILKSLSGPAGWATLAAGIGIAAGAIIGMNALMKDTGAEQMEGPSLMAGDAYTPENRQKRIEELTKKYPNGITYEGRTFDPESWTYMEETLKQSGLKVPKMGRGGIVDTPTLAMIGERGPEAVIPLPDVLGRGDSSIIINVQGSVITQQELLTYIKKGIAASNRRNFFGPVNIGYGTGTSAL